MAKRKSKEDLEEEKAIDELHVRIVEFIDAETDKYGNPVRACYEMLFALMCNLFHNLPKAGALDVILMALEQSRAVIHKQIEDGMESEKGVSDESAN